MQADREGGWLAAFYFLYFCALGAFMPYWGPWLHAQGQGPLAIGILTAAVQFSKVLAPNLWGWLAHFWGSRRIVPWAALITAAGFLALGLAHGNFSALLLITLTFSFFWAATLPLVDATTMDWAQRCGAAYGRIRLWGSLGFIALSLGMGGLLAHWGMTAFLPGIAIFLVAAWGASRYLPYGTLPDTNAPRPRLSGTLRQVSLWFFLLAGLLEQASHGAYYAFYSIYAEQHGLDSAAIGMLWGFAVLCEVAFFWWGDRLIRRLGVSLVFSGAFVLTALRWGVIAWWPGLVWIILVQSLHAASYAAFHLAAVHWVSGRFPGALRARGMALYASVVYGLGGGLGALGAGWTWAHWGGQNTFAAASALALFGGVFLIQALRPAPTLEKEAD
ncbi:MFS transporter [Acidithiobacillus ferrooxidans F221]|uniref:MFS transporter n=1 Tax=Acidithiobacillus ferrooxidans TaxID=920 RepID=UPI001C067D5F|nr:MFS transporter [Acidithiobacillus ferrooxidans]MBU2807178.1 MFS transporter [Acidithiobacillus ferrooxidans F221]